MSFTNNNNFNNSNNFNNGQNGDKKKTNFNIGEKVWGKEGVLTVSIWVAPTGVKTILSAKSIVGKDPSTGASVLEQNKPGTTPRYFLDINYLNALLVAMDTCGDPGTINVSWTKENGGKFSMIGQGNEVRITLDDPKNGTRTITLESITGNNKNIHSRFNNLKKYLEIAYKKALYNKLDPEEFAMVTPSDDQADGEDTPF